MAATDSKPVGGKPDKLVRDALMAALRQEPDKLKRIAGVVIKKAEEGDQQAINFIADRIDGKAVQPLANDVDNPLPAPTTDLDRQLLTHFAQHYLKDKSNA